MNDIDINDTRTSQDFKNITFSGFQKSKVKQELIKNINNAKIEPACYWSVELICSGHFIDLWEIIILICSKNIHIGNPKLPIYLHYRYNIFKEILLMGYENNELSLRNNSKIRKLFAEIICVLCLSPKKHSIEILKINSDEFEMAQLTEKLKADNILYCKDFFRTDDPKQLFIPINEFSYSLNKKNTLSTAYWLEWILQFETKCKQQKINIKCEHRTNIPVSYENQNELVWLIWDSIFNEVKFKNNKLLKKIINSLLELFCIKFTNSCIKKRKNILYFIISLLTEHIDININIISDEKYIEKLISKIDHIYKEVKKNEITPNTDYLFADIKNKKLEKTISKIEMMNELTNIENRENIE